MNKAVQFFKDWMLPLAITTGISLYLFYHFTPVLKPYGAVLHQIASEGQRLVIAVLLFFQFVQTLPTMSGCAAGIWAPCSSRCSASSCSRACRQSCRKARAACCWNAR